MGFTKDSTMDTDEFNGEMSEKIDREAVVLAHYMTGKPLTVLSCIQIGGGSELRRINSRLNRKFEDLYPGYGYQIHGSKINGNTYKTYFLTKMGKIA
jgi:hypothetical protein